MLRKFQLIAVFVLGTVLIGSPGFAEEDFENPVEVDDSEAVDDLPEADPARELLFETAIRDDVQDRAIAEERLLEAEDELGLAIADGADETEIERLTNVRDEARADLDQVESERLAVIAAIDGMTDEQVLATNRSLRNSNRNGMPVDLDADSLQDIVDRNLGGREIQALTKALEEEAKAQRMAARFERKYEDTGREHFLQKRDQALDRGERQRDKFDSKVDRFVASRDDIRDESRQEIRKSAKRDMRENARASARENAKDGALQSAKASARNEAKRAARAEARREAKSNGRGSN